MAAVFTVIAAFWGRVEYQIKQCTSWWEMSKGPTAAHRSVLLDYVSPMLPIACYQSMRNKHFAVSASIAIAMLLKLTVVVSTGLMTLSMEAVHRGQATLTTFNSFSNNSNALDDIGTLPYKTMQGVVLNNLTYPDGTNGRFAFPTFNPSNAPENAVVSGAVDGFSSTLVCEIAALEVDLLGWGIPYSAPVQLYPVLLSNQSFIADGCVANVSIRDLMIVTDNSNQLWSGVEGMKRNFWLFQQTSCGNSTAPEDGRVAISYGTVVQGPITNYNPSAPTISDGYQVQEAHIELNVSRSTQLLCKPTYQIQQLHISSNTSTLPNRAAPDIKVVSEPHQARPVLDIAPWAIGRAQFDTYQWLERTLQVTGGGDPEQDGLVDIGPTTSTSPNEYGYVPSQIQFGRLLKDFARLPEHEFLDPQTLTAMANAYWEPYTAFIAKQYLLTGPATELTGSMRILKERLVLHLLPVRFMQASLAVLALLSLVVLWDSRGRVATSTYPSNLIGLASILSASPQLSSMLTHFQFYKNTGDIMNSLASWTFSTRTVPVGTQQQFRVTASKWVNEQTLPQPSNVRPWTWWEPLALRSTVRLTVLILVIGVIVALELLLMFSRSHDGFGNANNDNWLHYLWTLLPAGVMVSIGLYFSAFDFSFKALAPYQKLHQHAPFSKTMAVNFLDQIAATALYTSISARFPAIFITTIASVISLLLTIVVSGVYSPVQMPISKDVQFQRSTWFNDSVPWYVGYSGRGMTVAGLVIYNNFTTPVGTYKDLAFPGLSLNDNGTKQMKIFSEHQSRVRATIPALRSTWTCEVFPNVHSFCTNTTWEPVKRDDLGKVFDGTLTVKVPIDKGLICSFAENYPLSPGQFSIPVSENQYFGASIGNGVPEVGNDYQPCSWGKLKGRTLQHLAGVNCTQRMEEMDVDAAFILPNFEIDSSDPPVIKEHTVRASKVPIIINRPDLLANLGGPQALDWLFQAMVYGKNGIGIEHLGSASSTELVAEALKTLTGSFKAIQYSTDCRSKTKGTMAATPIDAVLTDPNNTRVVQNAASTHILVGLLATMLLCAALASLLMDTRHLVPFEPGSIMAVGSLLANSNLLQDRLLPEASEWMKQEELKRALHGFVFGVRYPHELALKKRISQARKNHDLPLVRGDTFTIVAVPQDAEEMRGTGHHEATDQAEARSRTSEASMPASSIPTNPPSMQPAPRHSSTQSIPLPTQCGDQPPTDGVAVVSPRGGPVADDEPQRAVSALSILEDDDDGVTATVDASDAQGTARANFPEQVPPNATIEDPRGVDQSEAATSQSDASRQPSVASTTRESRHVHHQHDNLQSQQQQFDRQEPEYQQRQDERPSTAAIGPEDVVTIQALLRMGQEDEERAGGPVERTPKQHIDG